jgi:hypothetical protein
LEEQWETIGTGAPFVFHDHLCISYGLHTTRIYPREMTTLPAQWKYLNKNGCTDKFKRATTADMPAGSTYAVSADEVSASNRRHLGRIPDNVVGATSLIPERRNTYSSSANFAIPTGLVEQFML